MPGNFRPSADVDFKGTINGKLASDVSSAINDFNTDNNNKITAIGNAPVIPSDETAIDHVLNNGTADISFEWTWSGGGGAFIDGFMIYTYSAPVSGFYTFGTSAGGETIYLVPWDRRAFVLYGVDPTKYYHFGIRAYRKVDPRLASTGAVDANGIVANPPMSSAPVRPTFTNEVNGYQPSTTNNFSGTIDGTLATSSINKWSSISLIGGAGTPENNATVGAIAGTNFYAPGGSVNAFASTDNTANSIYVKQNTIKVYGASGATPRIVIGNLAG